MLKKRKATAWAHLPNAALIDAVIADAKVRPVVWDAAQDAAWNAAWDVVCGAAWGAALGAAWDAIYTLIAWDDCAHLLDLPSDTLRTMADLCDAPVCHQAVLLLPYVLVKAHVQEPRRQVTPA